MSTKASFTYLIDEAVETSAIAPHATTNASTSLRLDRSRTGVPNPKYQYLIDNDASATTNMTAFETSAKISPGFTKYIFKDLPGVIKLDTKCSITPAVMFVNDKFMGGNITQAQINVAVAQATARVYDKIRKYQTPFEGQIFAGELKEVFELIKNPFHKSLKLTDEVVRSLSRDRSRLKLADGVRRRNLTPLAGAAADQWLEYRFAILPLMGDISSLLTLAKDIAEKRDHETVRAYGSSIVTNSQSFTSTTSHGWVSGVRTRDAIYKVENIIRAGMSSKFLDDLSKSAPPIIDAVDDLSSIPVTAWELLPFSFLLDYFINVGNIVSSAVTTQRGLSYVSNSVITTAEIRQTSLSTYISDTRISSIVAASQKVVYQKSRYVDRTSTLAGIPPLVFSLPGSNIRYANIAALLTSWYSKST